MALHAVDPRHASRGGALRLVLPERDAVAVVNSWNVWRQRTDRIVNEVVAAVVAEP